MSEVEVVDMMFNYAGWLARKGKDFNQTGVGCKDSAWTW